MIGSDWCLQGVLRLGSMSSLEICVRAELTLSLGYFKIRLG